MFGKKKRTAATTPTTPTTPSDQYRLKSNGRRVTVLGDLGNGEVRIAMDIDGITQDGIVRARDITPA